MKKTKAIIGTALTLFAAIGSTMAQGTISLNNFDSDVSIRLANGTTLAPEGTTFVTLFGGTSAANLSPVISVANNSSVLALNGGPGYFDWSYGAVTGVGASGTGFFQLVAWSGSASLASATFRADSAVWSQTVGGVIPPPPNTPNPAPPALNIPGTSLVLQAVVVPEPSTFALAGLGSAALLIFRRRKNA